MINPSYKPKEKTTEGMNEKRWRQVKRGYQEINGLDRKLEFRLHVINGRVE